MERKLVIKVSILIIFLLISFGSAAVDLGTAVNFSMYTASGALSNVNNSTITGDVGSNSGAISGFGLPTILNGTLYNPGETTAIVAIDLQAAYNELMIMPVTDATHAAAFGSGETIEPGVYTIGSAATLGGELTLDAGGDANAVFIIRINGAYSTVASSKMILANGALAENIYWVAEGAISLATGTVVKGTLLAHAGAVSAATECDIEGRMLSIVGAISMDRSGIATPSITSSIVTRTSIASGNFNDASTWDCNCVPSSDDDVVIAHDLTLTDPFTVNAENSFTINSGKTLTFTSYINIAGAFTNNGTLSGGDLRFNGTSAQTPIIGSSLKTLTIDNSSGVTLWSNLDITSGLLLTDGELNLGGNELTMKASSASTAFIAEECTGLGSINGEVTVEQYVPEAGFGHHYLSSPMSGLTLSEWSDDFDFKLEDSDFPHLYYYDEPNTQWVTPAAANDAIPVGRGYTGYFSGDIVVNVSGTPNTADITIPLTNDGNGWNLIGNPFPSPIDWDNVTIPSGVSGAVYAWDHIPAIWGKYATYLDGIGTNGGSNIVPMMQGFFMSSAVNTNIVFYCEDRINTDNPGVFYRKHTATDPLIRLQASGFGHTTEAVVRFKTEATEGYDETLDALLFPSGDPKGLDFGTLSSDERRLVINTVPLEVMNKKIPLYVKIGTEGSYEIEMTELKHFSSTVSVLLHDNKLGVVHLLSDGPYAFNSGVTPGEGRFYVEATDITLGTNNTSGNDGFAWTVKNGQVNVTFETPLIQNHKLEVYSLLGQSVHVQLLESSSDIFTIPAGVLNSNETYVVKIHDTAHAFKLFLR